MAQAHASFLDTAKQGFAALGQLRGAELPAIPVSLSAPPQVTAPQVTAPQVTAPQCTEPQVTEPVIQPAVQTLVAPPVAAPVAHPSTIARQIAAPPVSAPLATAAPVVAKVSRDDLMALLLKVVSDKTGYPSDMLNMEMELEADLGIDSIKRVEILSAMQDAVPALPEVEHDGDGEAGDARPDRRLHGQQDCFVHSGCRTSCRYRASRDHRHCWRCDFPRCFDGIVAESGFGQDRLSV